MVLPKIMNKWLLLKNKSYSRLEDKKNTPFKTKEAVKSNSQPILFVTKTSEKPNSLELHRACVREHPSG